MFKKLHVQLTLFGTVISGLILIVMSLVCLSFSEAETRESHFADFQKNVNVLISHVESQSVLPHTWLSQLNAQTHYEISILDDGSRLAFETLKPLSLDDAVFAQARQKAQEEYMILEGSVSRDSVLSKHAEFEISSGKQDYYASVALIPKNGGVLNIAVLCPLSDLRQTLSLTRLLFAGADVAGILLLGIFFWLFTWRMIKPLIQNQQKQAEFIASASHELRSPLTVMLSCLSAMKQASPAEAEHFSGTIAQEGKRMSRLIDDMLTLSGMDSSHLTIQKTETELDTLLLSVYEKFEPLAQKKGVSLQIALPEELLPPCLCDKERIAQVLSILLDNALSYTPSGGNIRLSLQTDSDRFLLTVSDTGIGIPDSEKEAVFDRFYRCDKSRKDKSHFGLGLCIAKEIVRMHKGKIWVEDAPGKGASFVVTLKIPGA